jgi:hypothetical protein
VTGSLVPIVATRPLDRRAFLGRLAIGALLLARAGGAQTAQPKSHAHPDPRPDIDASHIVPKAQLAGEDADVIEAFDMAREVPQVLDGIRCHCGCADEPEHRSLLTCFEGDGMARHCAICRGQTRLAYDLHRSGRTLGVIRSIIDRRY